MKSVSFEMRHVTWILLSLAFMAAAQDRTIVPNAGKPRRMALVVGNNAYTGQPALTNPVNDAQALAAVLRGSGFSVTVVSNTDLLSLGGAVDAFVKGLHAGDVGLFYYSGHGMQVDGENYLIPIDFRATQEADVPYRAYAANRVLDRMQGARTSLSIVILDACRDNPFRGTRSGAHGLAAMNTGKGSFIAFATAPGSTASDNSAEANGLFTKYLLETMQQPGLNLSGVFDRVRERVYAASGERQLPWTASSVIGTFVFRDAAEERARLERELQELERQRVEAERRNDEQRRAEMERQATAVRERLKLQPPAESSAPAPDDLAELRRKRDSERAKVEALTGKTMTLEEARQEVASLEKRVAEARTEVDAARDRALQGPKLERGEFETTAEYEKRRQLADASRSALAGKFAQESAAEAKPYNDRIAELKARTFAAPGLGKVEWLAYDPDASRLTAKVDGTDYWFTVAPVKAKSLGVQRAILRAEMTYTGGWVLIDPATSEKFPPAPPLRVNPKNGLTYVWIQPGKFMMGCSPGDSECEADEKPEHEVQITEGFWMGQTEVTQEAYQRVTGKNPSNFKGVRLPVETVSWNEAQSYWVAVGMRLPTEAEWEYAARARIASSRYGDLDTIAWHGGNSGSSTHEVKGKQSNAWGLFDMLGNVWEWVADWYGAYSAGATTDPQGPPNGQSRVRRGGPWLFSPALARVSSRGRAEPEFRVQVNGFRCAGE